MLRFEQVKTTITIGCLVSILIAGVSLRADEKPTAPITRDSSVSVALALSGGGARGLAGIGVLKAFEERGIKVCAIAGTSIGGIVGGLYACGYSADSIKSIVAKVDFRRLFANDPPRASMLFTQRRERERHILSIRFDGFKPQIPHALTGGQELTTLLTELTLTPNFRAGGNFQNLCIPFKTVCTDIASGREVVLDTGSLADAMRATMAFPLAFTGVEREDQLLMDGGMLIPIPVQIAKQMTGDSLPVVAVNTTSPLLDKKALLTPVDIANQVTTIMSRNSLREQMASANYVVIPDLAEFSSSDFDHRDSVMARGYRAGLLIADSILRYPLAEASFRNNVLDSAPLQVDSTGAGSVTLDNGVIKRIDVYKTGKTRDWVVRSYFPLHRGERMCIAKAMKGLRDIYGTGLFDRVTLQVLPDGDSANVTIRVKDRKPVQARFGWHWDDHYQSEEFIEFLNNNVFGMGVEYLLHAGYGLDRRAFYGEIRADRIFSTYLTGQVRAGYDDVDRTTYDSDERPVGVRHESRWGMFVNAGQQIARLGTVTGGITVERVRYTDKRLPTEAFTLNTLNLESHLESFDQVAFPRSGSRYTLQLRTSPEFLASDRNFTRLYSSFESYVTFADRITYHAKVSLGISADVLPLSERFYLGGAHSFNGYRGESLIGDKYSLLNQELRVRLPLGLYSSARWDIGNVAYRSKSLALGDIRHAFGAAVALDTPIGPFELAYGRTSHGADRWYFSAGLSF